MVKFDFWTLWTWDRNDFGFNLFDFNYMKFNTCSNFSITLCNFVFDWEWGRKKDDN